MENTNTIFDTWMEAQNKLTKNWAEMNEKMQKDMIGGEALEKGSNLYKEWLQNQKTVVENLMGQPTGTAANEKNNKQSADANGSATNFFQNWLNTQNQAANAMMDASRKFYDNMLNMQKGSNPWMNTGNTDSNNWMNGFTNMFGNMNKSFADMPNFMNPSTAKDAFENMMKNAAMYNNMYNMMQPFLQNMQNMPKGGFDMEAMKKMFDPAAYKGMIDKMFGFSSTNNLTDMFEQTSKMYSDWMGQTRQVGDQFMQAFGKERDMMEGFMPSGSSYMTGMYNNMFNTFRQSMMPFFRISSPGNEQEQMDSMFEMQEKLVNYNIKQNEMQYLIYTNAAKAWNEVMEALRTRTEEGKEYSNFQEFYAEWAEVNEKIFIELFNTDEFSRLQGEVLSLGLDLKKGFEKQMEGMLEQYPVVLKSQLDEVYKTNYEMRKELRKLQKSVKEMVKTPAKPAAAHTAASNGADTKSAKTPAITTAKK